MTPVLGAAAFVLLAGAGAVTRWWLTRFGADLPWGTLAANTTASFVAGLVAGSGRGTTVLVGIALCGSLSTFSTLIRHLHEQATHGRRTPLIITLTVSLGLGVLAAMAGLELAGS